MSRLFGTDGIRGVAGEFPLDYASVWTLGKALAGLLRDENLPVRVLIGRDTRESGEWLEEALFHGFTAAGGDILSAGVIPTSAVSFLVKTFGFSAGIVISASHNPYKDNGIKVFSSDGQKISDVWEEKLEQAIRDAEDKVHPEPMRVVPDPSFGEEYVRFLKSRSPREGLFRRFKVVIDCSNGASSFFAPRLFEDIGCEIIALSAAPDGKNINAACGSLHPEALARSVVDNQADLGIAYDGDADRAVWVDERGRILNGDHTLYVQCGFMKEKGRLKADTVVATTMSNMALEKALENMNVKLIRARVGDRFVLEEMIKCGANLGGEQSGHTIFLDECPTGDGILTSLKMLEVLDAKRATLSELVADYREYPQVLLNVPVSRKDDFQMFPEIVETAKAIERHLGDAGRFHLRYSGTEPVARIMVEGPEREEIEALARRMADVLSRHLG